MTKLLEDQTVSVDHRGAGTVTASPARGACLAPERAGAPLGDADRYGRMFDLPALEVDEALLHQIGAAGGFSDAGDSHGDARGEAGRPFFGQYVAHDLTADRSPLRAHADVYALRNMRSPRANLESLYGGGPVGSPYLYRRDDPAKLLEGDRDVPRNQEGIALLGDPRNDTHVFMSQMQLAFIRAHNALVDRLRADGVAEGELFAEGRRALSWHYQWLIVNDLLPGAIGRELVDELLDDGPRYYKPQLKPFIPVEFADAAYRYGHSQIRQRYQLQPGGRARPLFPDLIGFGPVGERRVDWSLLFDVPGHPPAQRAKPIDGRLPHTLIELPTAITGEVEDPAYRSLAARDLQRGEGTGLPSGESVARAIGVEPLSPEDIGLDRYGWQGETPLWLYVLREAAVQQGGEQLGAVGGRIVGDVLVGVISSDPESYLAVDPAWTPTVPRHEGSFRLSWSRRSCLYERQWTGTPRPVTSAGAAKEGGDDVEIGDYDLSARAGQALALARAASRVRSRNPWTGQSPPMATVRDRLTVRLRVTHDRVPG